MWYIQEQMVADEIDNAGYNFLCIQLLNKHLNRLYDTLANDNKSSEDYKRLNSILEQHIIKYINKMSANKIEFIVYNYGIDNAIALLNQYNNYNKKYANTTSYNLLYHIFYNKFSICYMPEYNANPYLNNPYSNKDAIIIQRFWRNILAHRKELKKYSIESDITYLIDKINKEIVGDSAKKVLIYLVNKFKRRVSKT